MMFGVVKFGNTMVLGDLNLWKACKCFTGFGMVSNVVHTKMIENRLDSVKCVQLYNIYDLEWAILKEKIKNISKYSVSKIGSG